MIRLGLLVLNCYFLTGQYNPQGDYSMLVADRIIAIWDMAGTIGLSTRLAQYHG